MLDEGKKQHAPIDAKQKECTYKEVEENPNGKH
jgi:hypothetical protein